ncbi:hypothetical protein FKW77_003062 [Venturia effusa]|uniref:Uncharacterized protein n=1 Tax=Venturia effusa TaxID=50376 RepID=A0A517LAN3_9PEZI|nr:hypothetical protein FKW77_003062 [Venturia effusa]
MPVLDNISSDELSGTFHATSQSYLRLIASGTYDWIEENAPQPCSGFITSCSNVETIILGVSNFSFHEKLVCKEAGSLRIGSDKPSIPKPATIKKHRTSFITTTVKQGDDLAMNPMAPPENPAEPFESVSLLPRLIRAGGNRVLVTGFKF